MIRSLRHVASLSCSLDDALAAPLCMPELVREETPAHVVRTGNAADQEKRKKKKECRSPVFLWNLIDDGALRGRCWACFCLCGVRSCVRVLNYFLRARRCCRVLHGGHHQQRVLAEQVLLHAQPPAAREGKSPSTGTRNERRERESRGRGRKARGKGQESEEDARVWVRCVRRRATFGEEPSSAVSGDIRGGWSSCT